MSVSYWRLRDRYYRLMGVRCEQCQADFFPPVYICRSCGSQKMVDKEMPRTGTIVTYTELRETMTGFEDHEPLLLAVVQLDNGVRILTQLVDPATESVGIGDRVRAVFRKVRELGPAGQIHYGFKFAKVPAK